MRKVENIQKAGFSGSINALFFVFVSLQDLLSSDMDKESPDACSPTGVLEDYLRTVESDTNSSKATTSGSEGQQNSKVSSHLSRFVRLLKSRSKKPLSTLHPLSALKLSFRSTSMREYLGMALSTAFGGTDSRDVNSPWKNFTLSELQTATNNFSSENVVGKGGYAEVYKGCLQDRQLIAIKRLTRGTPDERIKDFLSEFGIMAHVCHPNTARLIGYGVEGGMHLVLEFSPHGSLASLLHGSKGKIEWGIRYKVALGTANGLLYLHEYCQRRIIHRDIKAANILLSEDYEPQICDFGLAKWLPEHWTHQTVSKFEGTFGYLAPEYLMHGIIDEKTDVFAFGVVLLELITGRRALDYSQQSLVLWAKPLLRKNKIRDLVDPSLAENYDSQQMNLMVLAASLCIRQSSIRRPQMSQVVQILKGNTGSVEGLKKFRKPFFQKTACEKLFDAEEDKTIKGLNALSWHKMIAFEF
ncbi:receptor-like cytosolic serine/threonine-protein kinase RBK2 [Malania oleifera]|uniref:receptor-like cytosolic serine/threonine-protein kinase RBK2 n=1 Tax=Malania oleifera TaxID=397392 RepID=UPI0025ADFE9D|nr:receptor-like cytosolic serine/threonine-protein kinase RBK2 [Malania oleifera]XP_057964610.1 receptor-like cytosolic serine/threonine-protein kinase RBK2 [Malania oleifera]